jgi:hypothetical protein
MTVLYFPPCIYELDLYCLGSSYQIQVKVPYLYTKGMSHINHTKSKQI